MNTYGPLPNASLLHTSGFTELGNPHDVVGVACSWCGCGILTMWWVWHAHNLVGRCGMVTMWWVWHVHDMVGRGGLGVRLAGSLNVIQAVMPTGLHQQWGSERGIREWGNCYLIHEGEEMEAAGKWCRYEIVASLLNCTAILSPKLVVGMTGMQ